MYNNKSIYERSMNIWNASWIVVKTKLFPCYIKWSCLPFPRIENTLCACSYPDLYTLNRHCTFHSRLDCICWRYTNNNNNNGNAVHVSYATVAFCVYKFWLHLIFGMFAFNLYYLFLTLSLSHSLSFHFSFCSNSFYSATLVCSSFSIFSIYH